MHVKENTYIIIPLCMQKINAYKIHNVCKNTVEGITNTAMLF